MTTITVKQFVMLLTSQAIVTSASRMTPDTAICGQTPYNCGPIARIYCTDGTSISVQAHGGCHTRFKDIPGQEGLTWYAETFGKELAMCETDCEELDQYGIDAIDDIEVYVAKHGGIDIETTTSKSVETAIKACKPYNRQML